MEKGRLPQQMKKQSPKKYLALAVIFIVFTITVVHQLTAMASRAKSPEEIKAYITDNNDALTAFAKDLYDTQSQELIIYDSPKELPKSSKKICNPFADSRILYISVEKGVHPEGDRVFFILKDRPDDKRYYNSGFYYSPTGTISDLYGNAKEGDYFEHDGGQTGERSRYRTEKIYDNWYYFEEAVW